MTNDRGLVIFDVAGSLPENWRNDVDGLLSEFGRDVQSTGRGPGSLEPEETAGLNYVVVSGVDASRLSWLKTLYEGTAAAISEALGERIFCREDRHGCINLNRLRPGGRYERHVDQNSHTVVIFADTFSPGDGGELLVEGFAPVLPQTGLAVAFKGSLIPHEVLTTSRERTTLVLSYCEDGYIDRPAGQYLYEVEQ
jgi:hypothetical protein